MLLPLYFPANSNLYDNNIRVRRRVLKTTGEELNGTESPANSVSGRPSPRIRDARRTSEFRTFSASIWRTAVLTSFILCGQRALYKFSEPTVRYVWATAHFVEKTFRGIESAQWSSRVSRSTSRMKDFVPRTAKGAMETGSLAFYFGISIRRCSSVLRPRDL